MTAREDAEKAATRALHDRFSPHRDFAFTGMDAMAETAVAAAAPILLTAERARIAAAIRAGCDDALAGREVCACCLSAARIAETAPEEGS